MPLAPASPPGADEAIEAIALLISIHTTGVELVDMRHRERDVQQSALVKHPTNPIGAGALVFGHCLDLGRRSMVRTFRRCIIIRFQTLR